MIQEAQPCCYILDNDGPHAVIQVALWLHSRISGPNTVNQ